MDVFDPSALAPYFRLEYFAATPSFGTDVVQLLPANPYRILVCIFSQSSQDIRIGASNQNKVGIVTAMNSDPLIFKFADWGGAVQQQFFLGPVGAGGICYSYCVNYIPSG